MTSVANNTNALVGPPNPFEAAPWMKIALAEMDKGVKEKQDYDSETKLWYLSLVSTKVDKMIEDRFGLFRPHDTHRPALQVKHLGNPLDREIKLAHRLAGEALAARNPEIAKYLNSVRSDPKITKGKSEPIPTTIPDNHNEWQVTAWCAAFVNWCLREAGAPHLGYATAASWLKFGAKLSSPEYGCIVVIKPGKATGSTSGHVAFYESRKGNILTLIGGNQSLKGTHSSDRVNRMEARTDRVFAGGYRWPTQFNSIIFDRKTRKA
jgi:uncharacterized protein (TIGR02594 family)